jgi:hypothetical protein
MNLSVKPRAYPRLPETHETGGYGDVAIYALTDAVTREIAYVGKTTRPDLRLVDHLEGRLRQPHNIYTWCHGRRVVLVTLEWITNDRREQAYRRWRNRLEAMGELLNPEETSAPDGTFYDNHGRLRRVGWLKKQIKKRARPVKHLKWTPRK